MRAYRLLKPARGLIRGYAPIILILAGYAALSVFSPEVTARRLLDFTSPLWSLLAAICLFYAARRTNQYSARLGLSWLILSIALLFNAAGDLSWAILQDRFGQPPFPSIADVFYLAYYPLLMLGIFRMPSKKRTRWERMKTHLDIYAIMLAAILVFWNFSLGSIYLSRLNEPFWSMTLALAYPVGDLTLLYCILKLLYQDRVELEAAAALDLAAAAGIFFLTDFIFSFQMAQGTYTSGSLLDVGWIAAYLLYARAGLLQERLPCEPTAALYAPETGETPDSPTQTWRHDTWVAYLPYVWLGLAFFLLIASHYWTMLMDFRLMAVCVGAIIILVIARQILTLKENRALFAQLNNALDQVRKQALELSRSNLELQIEIGERIDAQEQLAYNALHDPLTRLPNRSFFLDRLGHAVEHGRRQPDYHCALLFLDVDQFKSINDTLGHSAGDELLAAFGRRLNACLRTVDTVARFGGDEFVILLEDLCAPEDAMECARRILDQMEDPFYLRDQSMRITTSIGIVTDFREYADLDGIIHDADTAMYQAKTLGKARFEVFGAGQLRKHR